MGVPHFFRWLIQKKPDIIMEKMDIDIDHLYFDYNGLIHPACRDLDDEDKMIKKIQEYTIEIIEMVKPKKSVFIAIDGVAPRAKMNQQRIRRFRSVKEKRELAEIREKFNQPEVIDWDTNAITPGTNFMIKLSEHLNRFVKKIREKYGIKVEFTDWSYPMEGEHKIIRYIQSLIEEGNKDSHCIYGLDADLIMLSLQLNYENVYLVREKIYFREDLKKTMAKDAKQEFNYLYIKKMRKYLAEYFSRSDVTRIINDFVVLAFFVGNDFIPHSPTLNIRNKGLDTLMFYYREVLENNDSYLITEDYKINRNFLKQLLSSIAPFENEMLKDTEDNIKHFKPKIVGDPYKDYIETRNLIKDKYDRAYSFSQMDGKDKYYKYHFGERYNITNICHEYLKAIVWTANYYFKGLPSWDWFYPFQESPLITELCREMDTFNFDMKFEKGKPLSPEQQLLAVLPPQSKKLIKMEYQKFMEPGSPIYDFYPTDFEYCLQGKAFLYECHPIIPWVDIERLRRNVP